MMRLDEATGRPKRDRAATRRRLLEAARDLFAEHGYDHVTVRMIAARAEANVALVNRYFGSKAALFGEVLAGESTLRRLVEDGSPAQLPRLLAEYLVRQAHLTPTTPLLRSLDRSISNPEVQPIVRRYLEQVFVGPLIDRLGGPDARLRATLATSILMGTGSVRRTFGLTALRDTDPVALTARLTTMFQAALAPTDPTDPTA